MSCIWILLFIFWFPVPYHFDHQKTEGIAVFTGSHKRIEEGVKLLKKGYAKKLLISGVNANVSYLNLKIPFALIKNVDIGYKAFNTKGNAIETAIWSKNNNIKTIRIVTDKYHMKRSMLEFKKHFKNILVLPYPIEKKPLSCFYIIKEFHKYLMSCLITS